MVFCSCLWLLGTGYTIYSIILELFYDKNPFIGVMSLHRALLPRFATIFHSFSLMKVKFGACPALAWLRQWLVMCASLGVAE